MVVWYWQYVQRDPWKLLSLSVVRRYSQPNEVPQIVNEVESNLCQSFHNVQIHALSLTLVTLSQEQLSLYLYLQQKEWLPIFCEELLLYNAVERRLRPGENHAGNRGQGGSKNFAFTGGKGIFANDFQSFPIGLDDVGLPRFVLDVIMSP